MNQQKIQEVKDIAWDYKLAQMRGMGLGRESERLHNIIHNNLEYLLELVPEIETLTDENKALSEAIDAQDKELDELRKKVAAFEAADAKRKK